MWLALKAAHEDQTSGGRIHWLYKLFLTQMEVSDDVETHLSKMRAIFDWFKALITDSTPLVPDDLFAAALIISLTPDLLKVVRHLMIQPSMTSDNVIHTLTQDNTFAQRVVKQMPPRHRSQRPQKRITIALPRPPRTTHLFTAHSAIVMVTIYLFVTTPGVSSLLIKRINQTKAERIDLNLSIHVRRPPEPERFKPLPSSLMVV